MILFALLLAGCANVKQVATTEPTNQVAALPIEIDYITMSEQNSKDIMLAYEYLLTDAYVYAWAKGISAELNGKKAISKKEFYKMSNWIAKYIREFRGITGKVLIVYTLNGKTLYRGKF